MFRADVDTPRDGDEAPRMASDESDREPQTVALAVYQTVAARRIAYDSLLWQMPALSLTAQAFLFAAALSPGSSRCAQAIASALALSVSVASVHALRRFRLGQHMDQLLLDGLETKLGAEAHLGINPHASVEARANYLDQRYGRGMRFPPTVLWMCVLCFFGLAAAVLFAIAAFGS
jgi:hypothetical protein